MVIVKPVCVASLGSYRGVRLRALREAPLAFGSTYATESHLSDTQWAARVARWTGELSAGYLAWDQDQPCGLAVGHVDPSARAKAELTSMWVAPTHRRRGVGRLLVTAVSEWASSRGADELRLTVTSNNDAAIGFYERLGFVKTGETEPYPNDPALVELEMIRLLRGSAQA